MDFEQLAAQYSNMIHSIIHSLNIYKDHDEFYQIGLIALWNASERFNETKGQFSTYAYSFIKGRMLNHLNKEIKQEENRMTVPEEDWVKIGCEERLLEKETLFSHFYHLTDKEKQWVLLRFYVGLSNREIADYLQMNLTTVRSCERRAMKKRIKEEQTRKNKTC